MRAVLLVMMLALVSAQRENLKIQEVEQRHLLSCVVTVVQRHFPVGGTIQLSSTADDDHAKYVLKAIHRLELWPVQVNGPSKTSVSQPNVEKISSYIIFTRSVKDIILQFEMLYDRSSWDSRGLFLIVVTVKVPNSEGFVLSVIRELWQIGRGYNVVVVVQQDDLFNLYTWFPYSSHDSCADIKNVVLINQWVMDGEGKFVREVSLYPCKFPSNFHGCTVNLSAPNKGWIEDELYSQYFLAYNITRNYVNNFPVNATHPEKIKTHKKNLLSRECDLTLESLPLVTELVSKAEPTFPYIAIKLSWFVPCPKPLSRLQRISNIFSSSVWVAIVVVLFIFTVTSWCLAKQSNDIRSYTTLSNALYNVWAVTVGLSVTGKPKNLRLKLLFVVFVWYCSAINTVFQTFLTSVLVDPGYEKQLTSLDEILDSGIELGYAGEYSKSFAVSSDLRHKEVVERAEICSTHEVCIDRIRETGNFATFAAELFVSYYTNIMNDHSKVCLLNDEENVLIFLTTYVQKGSFFLESINKFIALSVESGMFGKTLRNSIFVFKPFRGNTDLSAVYFVFTLSHLRIAFYILLFGHGLSFLLFLCELFYLFTLRSV